MESEESVRICSAIYIGTEHFLANLLALNKVLGFKLSEAKPLCKKTIAEWIQLNEPVQIKSKLSTDDLICELEKYQIKIKIYQK